MCPFCKSKLFVGEIHQRVRPCRRSWHRRHCEISLRGNRPNDQFGTVRGPHLAEDPVKVLFDGAFGKVEGISNVLVGLALADESDNLPLSKAERFIYRPLDAFGSASRTDSFALVSLEVLSASKAVS